MREDSVGKERESLNKKNDDGNVGEEKILQTKELEVKKLWTRSIISTDSMISELESGRTNTTSRKKQNRLIK